MANQEVEGSRAGNMKVVSWSRYSMLVRFVADYQAKGNRTGGVGSSSGQSTDGNHPSVTLCFENVFPQR